MGQKIESCRILFDTNVVVSALLFQKGKLSILRELWQSQKVIPVVSQETVKELLRVLSYPKFTLSRSEQMELLEDYLPFTEVYEGKSLHHHNIPACRDKTDNPFLVLAKNADVDALVTGDKDLLALKRDFNIPILSPHDWLAAFRG